jgi:predicted nucleic acid-binding protein
MVVSRVFVDTSAILALLVPSDRFHDEARRGFARLRRDDAALVTTSYVLVETYALVGRRLGLDAVRSVREKLAPLLSVVWVDAELHDEALDRMLEMDRRELSLVDAVSFATLGRTGVDVVFSYDSHFEREGYRLLTGRR